MTDQFDYLEKRIEDQRKWHSDNATSNKKNYYLTEIIMLASGSLIPVINVISGIPDISVRILSATLAAIGVISAGIGKLCKFHETWLNYRSVAEGLKREKEFFIHRVGDYGSDQPEKILVERVESILSSVTEKFISVHTTKPDQPQSSV